MSLLDWITRKQQAALPAREELRSVLDQADSLQEKVARNVMTQIQSSSFQSSRQRDDVIIQRILGTNQEPTRDIAETLAVPLPWSRNTGGKS